MKKLIFPIIVIFFTSCMAFHTGTISSGPLLAATDKYVDVARGHSETNAIFGIGGLSKYALVNDAKKDMMLRRPLKQGEYYANFTVDFKKTVSFISSVSNEVFVHADVLSTTNDSVITTFVTKDFRIIKRNLSALNYIKTKTDSFYVGEKVVYKNPSKEIYDFSAYEITFINVAQINLKNYNRNDESIVIKVNQLQYSMDKVRNGFKYGDEVTYKSQRMLSDKPATGKVIATSANGAIVLEGSKTYEMKYEELAKINK